MGSPADKKAFDDSFHDRIPSIRSFDDEDITDDIDGHIQCEVENFFEKYFANASWRPAADVIVQAVLSQPSDPQKIQSYSDFLNWLWSFQSSFLNGQKAQYMCLENPYSELFASHIALVISRIGPGKNEPGWSDVLVIGQVCDEPNQYEPGLKELCAHARAVFATQPARLFLHGFYIFEGMIELWVFDRLGMYSCEAFNISENPCHILTVLIGYVLMSDVELGLSTLILEDTEGKYILCEVNGKTEVEKFYLEDLPIYARVKKDIVEDGLVCYRAKRLAAEEWEFVAKIKWSLENNEAHLLQLANEREVSGVAQLHGYRILGNTNILRRGLLFGMFRRFKSTVEDNSHDSNELEGASGSHMKGAIDYTIPVVSGDKWRIDELFQNITLTCIIVSPAGRSLHRVETAPEIVKALWDALKSHRSLYVDGGILHQDPSPGNIILKDGKGVLIDLGASRDMSAEPTRQFQSVGTPPFEAIGGIQYYLPDNPHTYRHDLEAIFYTFLFLAICPGPVPPGENRLVLPRTSILNRWYIGDAFHQSRRKTNDMQAVNFSRITAEFTPKFESFIGLAHNLRGILFPVRDGKLWIGTDMTVEGRDDLYDSMIKEFEIAYCSQVDG